MSIENPLMQGTCRVRPAGPMRGTLRVPGDKSISHRAVMMASLAEGTSTLEGFLESEDCINTLKAFEAMGVVSQRQGDRLTIQGRGAEGLVEPAEILDMGNSGTGTRLLLGILAGQNFAATLTGDSSLRSRPMRRVTEPLRQMGAKFIGRDGGNRLPLSIQGDSIKAIDYISSVASAQIKSALLLAGLFAEGTTVIREPGPSRDHTERMLQTFGVWLEIDGYRYELSGGQKLMAQDIIVPGDLSSAAFFIVGACTIPGSDLCIESVGLNPTRTGILDVLREMGADVELSNLRDCGAEPVGDIHVRYAPLHGTHVSGDTVVRMIDEFPIFAVAAAAADSISTVSKAEELRVKESDRISAIVKELGKMGVRMSEQEDGFSVQGGDTRRGAECDSYGDHRIAMSTAIAALSAQGETVIHGTAPIATSFPTFFHLLEQVCPGSVEEIQ